MGSSGVSGSTQTEISWLGNAWSAVTNEEQVTRNQAQHSATYDRSESEEDFEGKTFGIERLTTFEDLHFGWR
jgi:hypothetical protein